MHLLLIVFILLCAAVYAACWLTIFFTGKDLDLAFLGALIGAAGTIFAATIAYVAVQKQIDQSDKTARENAQQVRAFQRTQRVNEIEGLESVVEWCNSLISAFDENLKDINQGNSVALDYIRKRGLLVPVNGGYATQQVSGQAATIYQKLQNLAGVIQVTMNKPIEDPDIKKDRDSSDTAIASVRDDISKLRDLAISEIIARKVENDRP